MERKKGKEKNFRRMENDLELELKRFGNGKNSSF